MNPPQVYMYTCNFLFFKHIISWQRDHKLLTLIVCSGWRFKAPPNHHHLPHLLLASAVWCGMQKGVKRSLGLRLGKMKLQDSWD